MSNVQKFRDCREYQRFLRKTGNILDYVQIGQTLYTMDEYDHAGEYLTYGNKRTGKQMRIDTADRYKLGLKDAKVYQWNAGYTRIGINYID